MTLLDYFHRQPYRKRQKLKIVGYIAVAGLLVMYLLLTTVVCDGEPKCHLVSEQYTVQPGDTLWAISEVYMAKNTYGPRDIREYYHGIIENNYDTVFAGRVPGLIRPGDKLIINYWVREE